jgi:two-component system response regulator AtoC
MVYNRRVPPISASLMRVLQAYSWPGNIRQLENMVKRYVVLGTEACVANDLSDPAPSVSDVEIPEHGPVPLKKMTQQAMRRLERKIILQVLQSQHWNRRRTAEVLKISYRALLYKIRDAGLSPTQSIVRDARPATSLSSAKAPEPNNESRVAPPPLPGEKDSHA